MLCSLSSSLPTTGSMSQCLPLSITSRPNLSLTHLHACLACLPGFSPPPPPFTCYLILSLSCSNSINWNETLYFEGDVRPLFLTLLSAVSSHRLRERQALRKFTCLSEHSSGLSGLSYQSVRSKPKVWHPGCVGHKTQRRPRTDRLNVQPEKLELSPSNHSDI